MSIFLFQIRRLYQMAWKKWTQDGGIGQILYHMITELSKWKLFKEIYISLSIPVITRFGNSNLIVHFWNFLFFLFLLWKFRIFQIFIFFFIWDTTHYDDTEWNTDNPTQNHPPLHTINLKMFLKQCHSVLLGIVGHLINWMLCALALARDETE